MSDEVKKPPSEYQLIGPAEDGRRISDPLAGKTAAKESQQRPQALIAEWLRMENLVVLAGVGGGALLTSRARPRGQGGTGRRNRV